MALLKESFVTADAPKNTVPEDVYITQIVHAEIKTTNAGDGEYINTRHEIMEGDHAGQAIFASFNIVNPSEKAMRIAKIQLGELCDAIGVAELTDTEELKGQPMRVNVKIEEGSGGYPDKNVIKKYMPLEEDSDGASDAGWVE